MQGAGVFYNTYWIRYAHGRTTFDLAVENTRTLFEAAKRAGVGRIVHFSVTNPSSESGLPYFRCKAKVEDMLVGLGIPYAIIRPTLVFGVGDLLLNNMAWALRRFPVFPIIAAAAGMMFQLLWTWQFSGDSGGAAPSDGRLPSTAAGDFRVLLLR